MASFIGGLIKGFSGAAMKAPRLTSGHACMGMWQHHNHRQFCPLPLARRLRACARRIEF